MALYSWQLIKHLRAKVREQEEELRCLLSQLAVLRELTADGGEWGRFFKSELTKLKHSIVELHNSVHVLTTGQERSHGKIMATLQDMKDELAAQNTAILAHGDAIAAEIVEIKAALDALGQNPTPAELDEIVAGMKANTDAILAGTEAVKGIVETPLPEPTPEPAPVPEPEPVPPPGP